MQETCKHRIQRGEVKRRICLVPCMANVQPVLPDFTVFLDRRDHSPRFTFESWPPQVERYLCVVQV
jgi:hypothetical protein